MSTRMKGSRYGGMGKNEMINSYKRNASIYQQNLKKMRPSHNHSPALQRMLQENQNYVNDVSLMRKPNSKKLQQSPGAKNKKDFAFAENALEKRMNLSNKTVKQLENNPLSKLRRVNTKPELYSFSGGNKKIHMGPNGGKYVMVRCDGKMKKRYLKKK
jgi:hypothetical protein